VTDFPFDSDSFRKACGRYATGVAVTSVECPDGRFIGLTVTSFTSVSLTPPLVLVCIHGKSRVLPHIRLRSAFAVNILSADQSDLSTYFSQGMSTPCESLAWRIGPAGLPLLDGAHAVLECRLHTAIPSGSHEILLGEVLTHSIGEGMPLVRYKGAYCMIEPRNALADGPVA